MHFMVLNVSRHMTSAKKIIGVLTILKEKSVELALKSKN